RNGSRTLNGGDFRTTASMSMIYN
ncbi:fimbrial protein, partial [Escherichia coli]|nr:fimbrial protein [Escherichia coli]